MKYFVEKSVTTGAQSPRGPLAIRSRGTRAPVRGPSRHPALVPLVLHSRALNAVPEASVIIDTTDRIIYVNAAFTAVTGFSTSDVLGRSCRLLEGPETDPQAAAILRATLARGETYRGEILNYRKDGTSFWNALTVSPMRDDAGRVTHFVSVQRDVTAQRSLQDRLRFIALQDPLTGLANRRALDQHLADRNACPAAAGKAVAVGIIDLDDFNIVNDSFGHEAGDVLLAKFAQRLRGGLRDSDFAARLGGDEFVVVLDNLDRNSAEEQLSGILQQLHQAVESDFALGPDANVRVSMSMGLSLCPPHGEAPVAILRQADAALYRVKNRKTRGQWWHLHNPASGPAPDGEDRLPSADPALALATDLQRKQAVSNRERLFAGGLQMFFQPVIDLRTGKLRRLEALARLALDDGTILSPASFLPVLADTDFDWLFRSGLNQSLRQLTDWDGAGQRLNVSINLPPSSLVHPECPQWVASALSSHNIAPSRLVLELLEEPIEDAASQSRAFNDLLALGVGIAMDDLGAGHSSLRRLTAAAFSSVKIDHRILTQIRTSPIPTLKFLTTMIQMGRDMGWNVVAEGLEDAGITEAAAVVGIPYGQGYHLARPMPAGDVLPWLKEFIYPPLDGDVRTLLGALAFHWRFTRLGSPHPGTLESCPLTSFLDRNHSDAEAVTWHGQQHSPAADHNGSSLALLDWLTAQVTETPAK